MVAIDATAESVFEPDYESIKIDPDAVWEHYEPNINKLVSGMAYWKNFDRADLYQQSYLFFRSLCENYDPFYLGHFFPFDRYLFKNLIIKLRAYIQRGYVKGSREKASEYIDYLLQDAVTDPIRLKNSKLYIDYIYSLLNDRQKNIVKLSIEGYKQQEIGKKLNISQSRVSVIKKKTIDVLKEMLDDTIPPTEKDKLKLKRLHNTFYGVN